MLSICSSLRVNISFEKRHSALRLLLFASCSLPLCESLSVETDPSEADETSGTPACCSLRSSDQLMSGEPVLPSEGLLDDALSDELLVDAGCNHVEVADEGGDALPEPDPAVALTDAVKGLPVEARDRAVGEGGAGALRIGEADDAPNGGAGREGEGPNSVLPNVVAERELGSADKAEAIGRVGGEDARLLFCIGIEALRGKNDSMSGISSSRSL